MRSKKRVPSILLVLLTAISGLAVVLLRQRGRRVETTSAGYRQLLFWGIYDQTAEVRDHSIGWNRPPPLLGLFALLGLRNILRQRNLYDTTHEPSLSPPPIEPFQALYLTVRSPDGTYNDLDNPRMGMAGSRFGRNVSIEDTYPEPKPAILTPNPRIVTTELLTRKTFQPAITLNLLAAAWIQFMILDWFQPANGPKENPWKIPLREDDPWPEHPMTILRVTSDPTP